MIHSITGQLVEKAPVSPQGAYCLLLWQGLVWHLATTPRTCAGLPKPGENCQLYTALILRENFMQMVGFVNRDERDLFQVLLNASGVGPKVALSLLDCLSVLDVVQAVASGSYKPLTAAKGVGPKLAQKIVLDLKETMMHWRERSHMPELTSTPATEAFQDAESVLLSLGYAHHEISQGLQQVAAEEESSEVILRQALQWLAKAV